MTAQEWDEETKKHIFLNKTLTIAFSPDGVVFSGRRLRFVSVMGPIYISMSPVCLLL